MEKEPAKTGAEESFMDKLWSIEDVAGRVQALNYAEDVFSGLGSRKSRNPMRAFVGRMVRVLEGPVR